MAFTPQEGTNTSKYVSMACATGITITKGNALVDDTNGYLTNGSAGVNLDVNWVALETVTTTSAGQKVQCIRTNDVVFLADCDAAWAQTDVLVKCDLATAGTLNPDANDDQLFLIESGVGIATEGTQVVGRFVAGAPNA